MTQVIIHALEDDLAINLTAVRQMLKGYEWDWDERVHRRIGPRWVLRLSDAS